MIRIKLRCPRCKNTMLYQSKDLALSEKHKKCVYCGKNYSIKDNIVHDR